MKRFPVIFVVFTVTFLRLFTPAQGFQCNECHSKKPGMVRMHQALQGKGCFDCHKIGEKLMGKAQPKDIDSLLKRRVADPLCIECHRK